MFRARDASHLFMLLLGALSAMVAEGCGDDERSARDKDGAVGHAADADAPNDADIDGSAVARDGGAENSLDGTMRDAAPARDAAIDAAANLDASSSGAPSCRGLAPTCGPNGNEDCCASLLVPTATFWMGRRAGDPDDSACRDAGSYACESDEVPAVMATVRAFRLDRFEVTVGRFRKFVAAGGPQPDAGSGKHGYLNGGTEPGWVATRIWPGPNDWDRQLLACSYATWTATAGANENKPVNCVPWDDAWAFCIWDGGFLPTEAEWELAASGGEERTFPPGNVLLGAVGCFGECRAWKNVGSSPAGDGRFGQADLLGNVTEWVHDSYAPYAAACVDCVNLAPGRKVLRSGSHDLNVTHGRAAARSSQTGSVSGPFGMRCARAAE